MGAAEVVVRAGAAEQAAFLNAAAPAHDAGFCNKLYCFLQIFFYNNTYPSLDRFYEPYSFYILYASHEGVVVRAGAAAAAVNKNS